MKIRSHLLLLVLAAVFPILIFCAVMTAVFWREQRHAREEQYLNRVQAMAIALDRELDGTIRSLQVLGESPHLQSDDLTSFYEQAARSLSTQTTWVNIILNDPVTGKQLLNLRRSFGARLPDTTLDKATLAAVSESGQPYIPPLLKGRVTGQYRTSVLVPVRSSNGRRYVLVAVIDQASWFRFLSSYPIAPDATMTLLDQNGIVIARTLNPDRWIGQKASPVLYAESRKSPEGTYINKGLEGQWFYTAHSHSKLAGWTIATGVPKAGVEAALRQSTMGMVLGAGATAILAIALAVVFGRRIARPVSELADSAQALATGEQVESKSSTVVAEVDDLRSAFYQAAQRLRAQESVLRESEQRLRLAMQTGKVGVWDWDIVANRVLWTDSLYAIHGLEANDFDPTVEGFVALVHPEDRDSVREALDRTLKEEAPYELEFRAARSNGEVVWLFTNAMVVREGGRAIRMVGATMDISQRKEAEETIRNLLRISENLNSTLDVNSLLDLLVKEAIQLIDAENGVAGLRAAEGMVCHKYFFKGQFVPLERCWPPMHGLPGWLIVHKVPYLTNDAATDSQIGHELHAQFGVRSALSTPILNVKREVIGFLEVHNKRHLEGFTESDQRTLMAVSEAAAIAIQNALAYTQLQKAQESLRETDRRKDEFLAMLGHELRNPLGVISTSVQLLEMSGSLPAEVDELREIVKHQVEHMARLMDDLLDVSRIARGQLRLNREACDFSAIVRETLEDYRATFEGKKLQIKANVSETPLWVLGDRTRLAQVVSNLLSNATKFTENGGSIKVELQEDHAGRIVLKVHDTGVGMEPEFLARLFEPFNQADQGIARYQGGLGLGLALAKRLIELHGGQISAASEGLGRGSEVTIRLPLWEPPSSAARSFASIHHISRGRRILVIEDNKAAARTLTTFLTQKGDAVEVAHTGPDGVETARRFRPEVVLCDIGLPGFDGYSVAQRLRQETELSGVCLIALSGYGQEYDKQRAWRAGFDAYLVKPVKLTELESLLENPRAQKQADAGSDLA